MVKEHGGGKERPSPLSRSPRLHVPPRDTPALAVQGRRLAGRGDQSPPEADEEIRRLASMITRQASRGFTGETW